MGWLRKLAGLIVLVMVLGPLLALLPAAVVDRGPDGTIRATVFHVALGVLDPFVWDALRNSLAVATAVAAGSLVLGVALARIVFSWRFWGRKPLGWLAWSPLAVPPMFGAIGLRQLLGSTAHWSDLWGQWLALIWVGLACGTPWVALRVGARLAQIDPAWEAAAKAEGAGRWRAWSDLTWPLVRADAARAAALVFALTLLEPGAPMVLGLRRTLAFQVVEAALRPDATPRAAVLALIGLVVAVVGRKLVRWWGGLPWAFPTESLPARPVAAPWPRALAFNLWLGGWAAFASIPTVGMVLAAIAPAPNEASVLSAFRDIVADGPTRRLAVNSLVLGLAVGMIDLLLARAIVARSDRRPGPSLWRTLANWPRAIPPLSLGVGALMVPWLLGLWAEVLRADPSQNALAWGIAWLSDGLDPYRSPGLTLVVVVAAVRLPTLVRGVELGLQRSRPVLTDAAVSLGASRWKARRARIGPWLGSPPGAAWLLTMALASSTIAPALVLARTSESWTLGPGVLIWAESPEFGVRHAAALATCASALNLLTFAVAARRKPGPLGAWFRG